MYLYYTLITEHRTRTLKQCKFVEQLCAKKDIGFLTNVTTTTREKRTDESQEEYWRDVRYDWLERCTETRNCHRTSFR